VQRLRPALPLHRPAHDNGAHIEAAIIVAVAVIILGFLAWVWVDDGRHNPWKARD